MKYKTTLFIRISLFLVYFWFGALKLFNASPAEQLVLDLFNKTLAWLVPFSLFYTGFSLFECVIGVLFLWNGKEKLALLLTLFHLGSTALPLFVLPDQTWEGFMSPTLTGQYIIKNVLIIALALVLYEQTRNVVVEKA